MIYLRTNSTGLGAAPEPDPTLSNCPVGFREPLVGGTSLCPAGTHQTATANGCVKCEAGPSVCPAGQVQQGTKKITTPDGKTPDVPNCVQTSKPPMSAVTIGAIALGAYLLLRRL